MVKKKFLTPVTGVCYLCTNVHFIGNPAVGEFSEFSFSLHNEYQLEDFPLDHNIESINLNNISK